MKISKLYIGYVRKIVDVAKIENEPTWYKSKVVHKTIFLKPHENSRKVKDIIYGGRYRIGNFKANRVRSKYAVDLDQYPIEHNLLTNGYTKKSVGKRKLLKIMKDNLNK